MANKLQVLLHLIDDAIESADDCRALHLMLTNWYNLPDPSPFRERVAALLANRGRNREAIEIYELTADHYANAGFPTRCLAVLKQLSALEPENTRLLDHFTTLYNIRSPYLTNERGQADLAQPVGNPVLDVSNLTGDDETLLDRAIIRALDPDGTASQPATLPALPLLSLLPAEALRRVLDHIEYEIFAHSQPVLERDRQSGDLFWTVSSDMATSQEEASVRLPAGALLNLSGFGQAASAPVQTVMSQRGSELLRLPAAAIAQLSAEFPDFQNRLATLRRHALTEGLLRRHPLFLELEGPDRLELIASFVGHRIDANERLIVQGAPSPGLFIVLDGRVDIVRTDNDWEITIASLGAGEVVGEIGLVSDRPAMASVVTTTPAHVLHLARKDFDAAVERHPALARYAVQLANERIADIEQTLTGRDVAEVE